MLIFWVHILFLVTTTAGFHALMHKKLICFLMQLTAAPLFSPGFLPLSEELYFSSCSASKGLLSSDWPVQTHLPDEPIEKPSTLWHTSGLRFKKTDENVAFRANRNSPQGLLLLTSLFHNLASFKTAVWLCDINYSFRFWFILFKTGTVHIN